MHAHVRALACHIGADAARRAQRVDDTVLELQCAEMGVGDRRMPPAEITGERRARGELGAPVERAHRAMELVCIACREVRELEVDAASDA